MARCLNLTNSGEYAISALSRLALMSTGAESASVRALAAAQRIPKAFLAKILHRCAHAGLVLTKKGAAGGVKLARPADKITLLAIIEACEGSYKRDVCVFYSTRRCAGPDCNVYCPLRTEEAALREKLGRITLTRMAAALRVHPDAKKALSVRL
jgi:Rrf2 family protein